MSQDLSFIDQIDAWLLGQLSEHDQTAFELALETNVTLQQEVALAEEILAATWLAESAPVSASPSLFERLETSISPAETGVLGFASTLSRLLETTLEHAQSLLTKLADPEEWFPGPGPGTHLFHIDDVPLAQTAIVGFIRIEAGQCFPLHEHVGEECTFIVQGTLRDGDDLYHRGQIYTEVSHSDHEIWADGDEDVIYLTIADQGIKFGEFFIGPGDPEV